MLRKAFIVILSIFLFSSLSLTLAQQQQQPPLVPPQVIYGTAKVDNSPLDRFDTQDKVSIKLARLLVIFMDSYEVQGDIDDIIADLEDGKTDSLGQAFLDSVYCTTHAIQLSSGATVVGEPDGQPDTEWRIRSGRDTFTVLVQQVQVWNGVNWTNGKKLEVYQHNGLMDAYTMGELSTTDNYALELQLSPNNVLWGDNTYLLRDPGKAVVGDEATIYINDIEVTQPAMPVVIGSNAFVQMDVNAPKIRKWSKGFQTGWSLISFGVNKCYYSGTPPNDQPSWVELSNVADDGYSSLSDWFSNVLDPGTAWKIVIGDQGAMDRSLDPQFHSLKYMSPISSYWILIDESSGGATLDLQGQYYKPNVDEIAVKKDWNYVGYPVMIGFYDTATEPPIVLPEGATWAKVPAPVAAHVFSSVAGKYSMVIGQDGAYNPSLPPQFSSLHYMIPGQGFLLKMDQDDDLVYPSQ